MIKNIQILVKQCNLDIMFLKTKPVCVCVCGWLWGEVESGNGGMAVAVSVDCISFCQVQIKVGFFLNIVVLKMRSSLVRNMIVMSTGKMGNCVSV